MRRWSVTIRLLQCDATDFRGIQFCIYFTSGQYSGILIHFSFYPFSSFAHVFSDTTYPSIQPCCYMFQKLHIIYHNSYTVTQYKRLPRHKLGRHAIKSGAPLIFASVKFEGRIIADNATLRGRKYTPLLLSVIKDSAQARKDQARGLQTGLASNPWDDSVSEKTRTGENAKYKP